METEISERQCPFCGANLAKEDALCRKCGRFSKPFNFTKNRIYPLDHLNNNIKKIGLETTPSIIVYEINDINTKKLISKIIWIVCIYISIFYISVIRLYGIEFQSSKIIFNSIILLTIVSFIGYLRLKSDKIGIIQENSCDNYPKIKFLGYENNLIIVQLSLLISGIIFWIFSYVDYSKVCLWISITITILTVGSNTLYVSIIISIFSSTVLLCQWATWTLVNSIQYEIDTLGEPFFPTLMITILSIILTAFPQIQILDLGIFRVGFLAGDFRIKIFGSKVIVPLGTSIFISIAWVIANDILSYLMIGIFPFPRI